MATARRREWGQLGRLAAPLAFVQLNATLTGVVDTAMAGRAGEVVLAGVGLGSSIFMVVASLSMACGLGADPLMAQAVGAGRPERGYFWLWQALFMAAALSVPLWLAAAATTQVLPLFGIEPALVHETHRFLLGRLPSLPLYALVWTQRCYLQALHCTRPVVLSAVVMNLFNGCLDYVLLFGDAGLLRLGLSACGVPALGSVGVGLASTAATLLQLGLLALAIQRRASAPRPPPDWRAMLRVLRLGLPAGLQILAEVGLFTMVSLFMGGLGATVMAAHQSAIMLCSCTFSLCVGVGSAAAVQVGRAVGRRDIDGARRAGGQATALGMGLMGLSALAMWIFPVNLMRLMTDDLAVVATGAGLLRIAGFFQLADGAQAVLSGALRGAGETRWSFVANCAAHWGCGLPVAVALAYGLGWGPEGLWWGLTAGLVVVSLALIWRFAQISRGPMVALEERAA